MCSSDLGANYQIENVTLHPLPGRQGGPPILMAAAADRALRRLAQYADGWLPIVPTAEEYAKDWARIEHHCAEFGRACGHLALGDGDVGVELALAIAGRTVLLVDAAHLVQQRVELVLGLLHVGSGRSHAVGPCGGHRSGYGPHRAAHEGERDEHLTTTTDEHDRRTLIA